MAADMYQESSLQHVFRYSTLRIFKKQSLGNGAYGAVYKAKCDQLPCAAKILHQTIVDPRDAGADKIMKRFKQECSFLESIRHPHIVQYLGVSKDPESRLPVLLMELLDESLTNLLERSQQPLAFHVEVDICHDIALAVVYLHSNDIIHRDLSSNNVLIIAERRAKVTDFGMSKLANVAPSITPLTICPGTVAYMPPEALREPPRYTKKLDCFSEGVLMIQVCTRLLPDPGPRTQLVLDARSPTGAIEMPVLETERRKGHIDLIDSTHPMLPIAMDCLSYQESERPSSEDLCQKLGDIIESIRYRESSIQRQNGGETTKLTQFQFEDKIRRLTISEEASKKVIQQQNNEIQRMTKELVQKERFLQQKDDLFQQEVGSHNEYIQVLNCDLNEQKKLSEELVRSNHSLKKEVSRLQQLLAEEKPPIVQRPTSKPLPPPPVTIRHPSQIAAGGDSDEHVYCSLVTPARPPERPQKPHQSTQPPSKLRISLEWRSGGKAPDVMERGDAVVNGNVAYFVSVRGESCSYNAYSKKWNELPKCPYAYCSLVVIYGHLTAIGGCTLDDFEPQNKLMSRMGDRGWTEHFPHMPTKRWKTVAVSTPNHLVVAGGKKDNTTLLNIVEVMDIPNMEWSAVPSLPHPYSEASATICGGCIYILGGFDNTGKTKSVLASTMTELLQRKRRSTSWRKLADAPVTRSTCATVSGVLVAVGGLDSSNRKTSAIYAYNSATDSWDIVSNMPTAQYDRLVAILPTNEIIVVGGCTRFKTDNVDIAKICK